ncbi:prepilin-type N-terminal cleavage/methylation domain-containing protein [Photobacterium damselae]|uniref:prepilin-type N-terminal cleavage/methylation domain-containing protein n=1 Tax=Photobacterium damselae TaxID=38293 RepID=UPI004067F266
MLTAKIQDEKGFTLLELLVVLVVIAILTLVGMAVKPKVIGYMSNAEISAAVDAISTVAPSYMLTAESPAPTMSQMCKDRALSKRICGEHGDGTGSNPFGGDYKVGKSSAYPGHVTVTVTGIKSNVESVIVSNMIARSLEQCTDISRCNSAQITRSSGRNGSNTSIEIDV